MRILTRFGTGVCIAISLVGMYGLMYISAETQELESQVQSVQQQILTERRSLHVLETEWAYLTRPSRLTDLLASLGGADNLSAPTPDQYVDIQDIPHASTSNVHVISYEQQSYIPPKE